MLYRSFFRPMVFNSSHYFVLLPHLQVDIRSVSPLCLPFVIINEDPQSLFKLYAFYMLLLAVS